MIESSICSAGGPLVGAGFLCGLTDQNKDDIIIGINYSEVLPLTVLREIREKQGKAMADVAFDVRILYPALSAIEKQTRLASKNDVAKLSTYYGVDSCVLFDERGMAI